MAAAVDLKQSTRGVRVLHLGVTFAADICNLATHQGLLEQSSKVATDIAKDQVEDKMFTLNSEEELKVYDTYKSLLGFQKATEVTLSQSFVDSSKNDVKIISPYKDQTLKSLVKYEVVKNRQIGVGQSDCAFTQEAIKKLQSIEKEHQVAVKKGIEDKTGKKLAVEFMKDYGSHFQSGTLKHGGAFEWVVCWESDQADGRQSEKDGKQKEKTAREILKACKALKGSATGIWYDGSKVIKSRDQKHFDELQKYHVRITKLGGGKQCANFDAWKTAIVGKSGDKVLVDGESFTPIWELVKQNPRSFTNSNGLSKFLEGTWKDGVKMMALSPQHKLLKVMGLLRYQERGISIYDVRAQTAQGPTTPKALEDIPWLIIEKLMRMDYKCRDNSTVKGIIDKNKNQLYGQATFHPMDIFYLVFCSCDMIMRQVLVQKMALSRLSIPFINPSQDGKLQLSLWPLRSIAVEWMKSEGKAIEVSLVKHPFKIVSVVRLGKSSVSKSNILNEIMSEGARDTFFHREASGGKKKRYVANGMVEMSYYLPHNGGGTIKDETLFLNLRGDAVDFEKQFNFLKKIGAITMCIVDLKYLKDEAARSVLYKIKETSAIVIVILTAKDLEEDDELVDNETEICTQLDKKGFITVKTYDVDGSMSIADLADVAAKTLARALCGVTGGKVLEDEKGFYRENGIVIDEDEFLDSTESKKDVDAIIQELRGADISKAKTDMLPLQGKVLQEWTTLLKEKHRGKKDSSIADAQKEKSAIIAKMNTRRKNQFEMCKRLKSIMKIFIDSQQVTRPTLGDNAFFKRLKIELDDLSRSILPGIRQKYLDAWSAKSMDLKAFKEAEQSLDDSSFGAEHLFREMGQLYECIAHFKQSASQEQKNLLQVVPQLAAKYFLSGHSLELMDGDSGLVPLDWVTAVLESLQTLIGEKKMFVLSVVGVQSSGKSTLLNTMFGLELAVGAGRCTRGVYAQLLPVNPTTSTLPVDYILVIDSEGLCGTKAEGKFQHDNEIATLVIGLADLTLVNIKGENVEQMKNVFEIAVHAFLRMKAVKQYKKQKCVFLHQSVSTAGAVPQLMRDRHTLQENLDAMTLEAASVENMSGTINKFCHVIDFDCDKDVFYIPDLWNGVPPMARVSPGYSDKIKEVRDLIMREIEVSECCVTADDLQLRIEEMWNGVLSDDFLFSFKNTISLKAYLMLETKFYEIKRSMESELLEYMNKCLKVELDRCESKEAINACYLEMKQQLEEKQQHVTDDAQKKLESFFENSEVKEHLAQWQQSKKGTLDIAVGEIRNHMVQELKYFADCRLFDIDIVSQRKEVLEQAQTLATTLKETSCDDEQLSNEFTNLWNKWEIRLNLEQKHRVFDAKQEMGGVMEEIFKTRGHTKFLKEILTEDWFDSSLESEQLQLSQMRKDYLANKEFPKDVSEVAKHGKGTELVPKQRSRETYFPEVLDRSNDALGRVQRQLASMMRENLKFHPNLAHDILKVILDEVDAYNSLTYEESLVSLTPRFEAMIALHVARIAYVQFENLNHKFVETCSIKAKMEAFKLELSNLFFNTVHSNIHGAVIDLLCDKINQQISENIHRELNRMSVDKMLDTIKFKKHTLLVQLLTSLAEKSFTEYSDFLKDMYGYASKWMENEGKKILFAMDKGISLYGKFAKNHMESFMMTIKEGVKKSVAEMQSQDPSSMEAFVDQLNAHIGQVISLSESDCATLKQQKVVDFDQFEKQLLEKMEGIEEQTEKIFIDTVAESVDWGGPSPYQQVMEKVWGCTEKCPLCLAPCIHTNPNHVTEDQKDHECNQHWPALLGGTKWVLTGKLSTEICSFSITTDTKFRCSACRFKCRQSEECKAEGEETFAHPYRYYKDYLKDWEIDVDATGEASTYWQWVAYRFQEELEQHYNAKKSDIPEEWDVSKEEAIKSLNKLFPGDLRNTATAAADEDVLVIV